MCSVVVKRGDQRCLPKRYCEICKIGRVCNFVNIVLMNACGMSLKKSLY